MFVSTQPQEPPHSPGPAFAQGATAGRLARSAGVTGAATMTSRLLGLAREQVIASLFGAGDATDAYNVAFRIPNLIRDLFAEGAMSAAFVPTFTRELTAGGKEAAWRFGNILLNALLIITAVIVVAAIALAWPLVRTLAGDYAAVPGKVELTVFLTRIMLPMLTLVAVAAALMGMLNALHRFFIPALSPAMFNIATVVCAFALVPLMPRVGWPPITAIAIGAIAGGVGQVALQWPALSREGFRYRPIVDFRNPALRRVLLLMGPGTLGLAATQFNLAVNTVLATGQGTGAVSWLQYAFRIMYLPIGLFGISVATASVPAVSSHAAADDRAAIRRTTADGLSLMLMLNVPATLGLVVLANPIVALLFERRAFTAADTLATAGALQFYAIGLLGYSVVKILSPTFYALDDSRTPVLISTCAVIANVVLSLALVQVLGYRGLALGTSLAALLNGAALAIVLRRRLGGIDGRRIGVTFTKIAIASLLMTAIAALVYGALERSLPGHALWAQIVRLGAAMLAALATLAGSAFLLRITEFEEITALVRRRARP